MIRRTVRAFGLACGALLLFSTSASDARAQGGRKPSLSLKASPAVSFAPARVVAVGELRGGTDEEAFYCPTVEWEWDDGTFSSSESDCSPYEPGKTQIKRRFTAEHQYKFAGNYRIVLRLKKGSRVAAAANTSVQVRPGLGPP